MFKQSKGDHSGKANDMTGQPSPLNMSLSFLPGINTLKSPRSYLHKLLNRASYHIKTILNKQFYVPLFQF